MLKKNLSLYINFNTFEKTIVNNISYLIRSSGKAKRDQNGKIVYNELGSKVLIPGKFKNLETKVSISKEFGITQMLISITDLAVTSLENVFDEILKLSTDSGIRVTGTHIKEPISFSILTNVGKHYLKKQKLCTAQSDNDLIDIAIRTLGLNDLEPFDKQNMIINDPTLLSNKPFFNYPITKFIDKLASKDPAPGGGGVSALNGALAAALTAMVVNLTYGKKGYEKNNKILEAAGNKVQEIKREFLFLIEEDRAAFTEMMDSFKNVSAAKKSKDESFIERANSTFYDACKRATNAPLRMIKVLTELLEPLKIVTMHGNFHAISDAGVAAFQITAGAYSANLNIKINLNSFKDEDPFKTEIAKESLDLLREIDTSTEEIESLVDSKIRSS